jgi:hydrogenase-4 component F
VILGLATLLVAGFCLLARRDTRRSLAFAGSAQTGIVVFAFGLGGRTATLAGLLLMTLTTLAKAAALQCAGPAAVPAAARTHTAAVLALAGLPIYALFLVAGSTADYSAWLLLPLGAGVLLTAGSLAGGLLPGPIVVQAPNGPASLLELAPVWLQLVVALLLAVAIPSPVLDWFRRMVELG